MPLIYIATLVTLQSKKQMIPFLQIQEWIVCNFEELKYDFNLEEYFFVLPSLYLYPLLFIDFFPSAKYIFWKCEKLVCRQARTCNDYSFVSDVKINRIFSNEI